MKTGTWKLAMIFAFSTGLASQAQTLSIPFTLNQSSPAVSFGIDANGTLTETGPLNSSATFTFASGPQMVWLPAFGAFRAGAFYISQTIGQDSVAFGSSIASGSMSAAFDSSTASGSDSVATGYDTTASGYCSVAMGFFSTSSGSFSLASGVTSSASGTASTALGDSVASGGYATALGYSNASGLNSTALGYSNASGLNSTALGQSTASGSYATAAGVSALANSYDSFVVGTFNVGLSETLATPNSTAWVSADPLFEVGNGTSSVKSDALVVYKDGSAQFSGPVKVPQSGDIPMYTGN